MVAILILVTIILFLTIDYFVQRAAVRKELAAAGLVSAEAHTPVEILAGLAEKGLPRGVFFDPSHQWMQLEPSGTVRFGVDRLATAILGRPDGIEFAKPGTDVRAGDVIATLRKGKRSLSIRTPIDGRIQAVNGSAIERPSAIEADPFGKGWLFRVTPKRLDLSVLTARIVGDDAFEWMKSEFQRLREFLTASIKQPIAVGATLPDGGMPANGLSKDLDDEQWEELKAKFFVRET